LAEELDEVELLLSNDGASTSSEDDHSALEEVDAGDGQGEQLPEAGSDCLDLFELVVDDEEKRDSEVQQDKSDLHPSVEESLRALFKRELTLLVNIVAIISSHLQRVNVLQISNLNEVGKAEELLDAGKLALLVMVDVDDLKDLSCCVAMRLVVIVEVEDILEELLSFVTIKIIVLVDVVVVEELFNILEAFRDTSATLGLKSRHVLVEDICEEQIGQEVQTDEHETHEQECVEVVDVHRWQENVGEISRSEQNCHITVGVLKGIEAHDAFECRSVEVVDSQNE